MTFTDLVRAEQFPTRIDWQWRDTFAICIIPLILLNGYFLEHIFGQSVNVAIGDTVFRGILSLFVRYTKACCLSIGKNINRLFGVQVCWC